MALPETSPAAIQQESIGGATTTPKSPAVFTSKTGVKHTVLTDDQGPYIILRIQKPDGKFTRVKRRIPTAADEATVRATPATPVATTSVETATVKPSATTLSETPAAPAASAAPAAPTHLDANTNLTTPVAGNLNPVQTVRNVTSPPGPKNASGTAPATTAPTAPIPAPGNTKMASRLLQRLGGHAIANAFIPDWDLGEMQEGDVSIDEDDDSDDGRYDSDDDNDRSQNQGTAAAGNGASTVTHSNSNGLLGVVSKTGSAALLNSAGRPQHPPKYGTASLEKEKLDKSPGQVEKPLHSAAKAMDMTQTEISEKQVNIDGDILEKPPAPPVREPRPLSKTSIFIRIVIWSILIGFPLLFIILGILTAHIGGRKTTDSMAKAVHNAITIAVTAWPIVFAAIVAQSLRTLATWRVERGIKLMRLEQLISSNSVAAAVKGPFFLRRIDFVSIGLLLLWSLSPIASQALQRMSVPGTGTASKLYTLFYVDTTGENLPLHVDSHNVGIFYNDINLMYGSAMPPQYIVQSGTDTFNNPIIPVLGQIENPVVQDGWTVVQPSEVDKKEGFSTIFGIPFEDFRETLPLSNGDVVGNMEMQISSSYLDFDCAAPKVMPWADFLAMNLTWHQAASYTLSMRMIAADGNSSDLFSNDRQSFMLASARPVTDSSDPNLNCTTTNTQYMDIVGCFNSTVAFANCTFQRTYVDTILSCIDGTCAASKMRLTPAADIHVGYTYLDTMIDLSANLASVEAIYTERVQTVTERWLVDPDNALQVAMSGAAPVDLASISAELLTKRLGQIVNTYWQIGFSPANVAGGLTHATDSAFNTFELNTTAKFIDTAPIYVTQDGWLAGLFLCSFALLIAGVGSAIFETLTVGPDVLGFASSIVRQSKYVRIPDAERGGSTMGGAEQARKLGDVVVMMQDVRPEREVGRIALGTIEESSKRLRPGRLYR